MVDFEQVFISFPIAAIAAAISTLHLLAGLVIGVLLFQLPLWTRAFDRKRKDQRVSYLVANLLLYLAIHVSIWGLLKLLM